MKLMDLFEQASELETLKRNKVALSDDERQECIDVKAVWHHNQGKPSPAVWKSINPKSKKVTYVTNTHRAYDTAPTLKGAIKRYHDFIKDTA